MSYPKKQIAILISGRGSNMNALIKAANQEDYPCEIALIISNKSDAKGIEDAKKANIPTRIIDHKSYPDRQSFEETIDLALNEYQIDFVCNAGFLRLLTPWFVSRWYGKNINIHPSLLPAYKGLHTHERALRDGIKIHGCTVHFVSNDMDSGAIIGQAALTVLDQDTPESLAERVLKLEHELYPICLRLVAENKIRLRGENASFSIPVSTHAEKCIFSVDIDKKNSDLFVE